MKKININLPLPLLLFLICIVLVFATFYVDFRIISDFSQAPVEAEVVKSLELNQKLYQQILDNNKNNTTLSPQGNIGRFDPFAAIQ